MILIRQFYDNVYLFTHLLTPWSRVLFGKLTGLQLINKFPAFYGTRRFITAFTSTHHLSLSWASSIQSITQSHFLKIHLNIILLSKPGSPQWSPSPRLPHQKPVHAPSLPLTRYMLRPSHSSRFYHPHNTGWGVKVMKLLIVQFSPLSSCLVLIWPK